MYKTFLAGVFRTKAVVSAPMVGFPHLTLMGTDIVRSSW